MSFGNNLSCLRKMHNNMSQEELAFKLNVSRQTISKWEMDNCLPDTINLIAISKIFKCTIDDLFNDDFIIDENTYFNLNVIELDEFYYYKHAIISTTPEDDAIEYIKKFKKEHDLEGKIIGWDFPLLNHEQVHVYHMHGYVAAIMLDKKDDNFELDYCPKSKWVTLTIKNPFNHPFQVIPNGFKILERYIEQNYLNFSKEELNNFEYEYVKENVTYMDIFIRLEK